MARLNDAVEYRPAYGLDNYRVGDDGSLWRFWAGGNRSDRPPRWTRLNGTKVDFGYVAFILKINGKYSRRLLHRLVLDAFVGPRPDGCVCCHADGDAGNNRLSNLRWDSQRSNVADTKSHGRLRMGENHGGAKLTENQVREIIRLVNDGVSQRILAKTFGVSQPSISMIVNGKTWKSHSQVQHEIKENGNGES